MEFASDNTSGAAPEILAAVQAANGGYAPSYGADALMDRVRERVRATFEAPEAEVFLVATGTTANALSLSLICPPWGSIYCHAAAHVENDELGAVELFTGGGKLTPVDAPDGKVSPDALRARLAANPAGDVHHFQPGALTLTNLAETGTAYRPAEIAALTAIAREHGMKTHMDGARFANAVVGTATSPAELTWKAGIDILSFGGTKNGCMGVEAVVLFDPAKAWELELRRKRAGHLFSKHRYLSAQMDAYLTDGLWLRLAAQANRMASRLADGLAAIPGVALDGRPDGNLFFARLSRRLHRRAMAAGAHYHLIPYDQSEAGPEDGLLSARFVCSWSTTAADVDGFLAHLGCD